MENAARLNKQELIDNLDSELLTEENRAALLNKKELLEGKRLLVDRFVDNVILGKDFSSFSEFLHEDIEIDSMTGIRGKGWDCIKASLNSWHSAFEIIKNESLHRFVSGDFVISHWRVTAKHIGEFAGMEPTHKEMTFSGMNIYRVVDNKIWSITGYSNFGLPHSSDWN